MVQKGVAAFGVVFLAIGLALTVVISIIEDWVRAELNGVEACASDGDTPVGTLGLFSASFRPDCAAGTNLTIQQFSNLDQVATTEFWPLFPAQQNFGDFFADNFGTELTFSSCEETFAANQLTATASSAVAFEVNAGLAESHAEVKAAAEAGFSQIGPFLTAFWAGNVQAASEGIFGGLAGAKSVELIIAGLLGADFSDVAVTVGTEITLPVNTAGLLGVSEATVGGAIGLIAQQIAANNTGLIGAILTAALGNEAAPDAVAIYGAVLGAAVALTGTPEAPGDCAGTFGPLFSPAVAIDDTFLDTGYDSENVLNIDVTTNGAAQCWAQALQFAVQSAADLSGDEETLAQLAEINAALGLFSLCELSDSSNLTACSDDADFNTIPADLNAEYALCKAAAPQFGIPDEVTCSAAVLFDTLAGAVLVGAIDVPDSVKASIPTLQGLLETCAELQLAGAAQGLVFPYSGDASIAESGTCESLAINPNVDATLNQGDIAQQQQIPDDWSIKYALCAGVTQADSNVTCDTFQDFVDNVDLLGVDSLTAALQGFNAAKLGGACPFDGSSTSVECAQILPSIGVEGFALVVFNNFYDEATSFEELIEQCEDDNTDAAAIENAQVLIPAAIGIEGVALLLGLLFFAVNKSGLLYVSALLSIGGTACTLIALLGVLNAPVYASVGTDTEEEDIDFGEQVFSPGLANTLGLVAILMPGVAALLLAGSTCCSKEDESDLENKVDNTY